MVQEVDPAMTKKISFENVTSSDESIAVINSLITEETIINLRSEGMEWETEKGERGDKR